MRDPTILDKIDLHLIRVLHTVLTERSVSRAAIRLGMHQPAVSASLKRLRDFAGDPLLVRSGSGMVPTEAGLRMVEPSASILRGAQMLFGDVRSFEPATARTTFRIAASDYLDSLFLPQGLALHMSMERHVKDYTLWILCVDDEAHADRRHARGGNSRRGAGWDPA